MFLCQLLRGCNKINSFTTWLVTRSVHHQDLPNKWFERRLKRMAIGFSPFLNSQGNFKMTSELFGY